jgi:hypothetical protein
VCDYRFFIDFADTITPTGVQQGKYLQREDEKNMDMVFRNTCSLMQRHPYWVNYGNSPPFHGIGPHYQLRRMYKVDWKVCFLKWAQLHKRMAIFHAFVEDDSFTCVENLLSQLNILKRLEVPPFRTGFANFDGYDDSSTLMSREIALAFVKHYPEAGFNCSRVADDPVSAYEGSASIFAGWHSWGNSWSSAHCNWRETLNKHLDIDIIEPAMHCFQDPRFIRPVDMTRKHPRRRRNGKMVNEFNFLLNRSTLFPCKPYPLIRHMENVLTSPIDRSTCKYSIFLDKIKSTADMHKVWKLVAREHDFFNYSTVFKNSGVQGWDELLEGYEKEHEM